MVFSGQKEVKTRSRFIRTCCHCVICGHVLPDDAGYRREDKAIRTRMALKIDREIWRILDKQ